jgi:hypothetical protein
MRIFQFTCLITGLLLASAASADLVPANDVGVSVVPQQSLIVGTPVPQGGVVCPDAPVLAAFSGANTQDGRIFRDAIPSACPNKAYPGIFGEGTTFNYETFTYTNTDAAAACVTVNFNPDTAGTTPCATNAHASAYIDSYDPANQAVNFVGDVGSSLTQPFSFEVPGGQNMVLVVTNTSSAAVCDFAFEVVALPCDAGGGGGGDVLPVVSQVPASTYYGLALLALLLGVVGFFTMRPRG